MARTFAIALALVFGPGAALAQWDEDIDGGGDAGELLASAQMISGSGALTTITGTNSVGDTDLFAFDITNVANFSASTLDLNTWDTQLFLFDSTGRGITADDDDPATGDFQSIITSQFVTSNGRYYLALSQYNRDPRNAANQLIWLNTPYAMERAPDGPGMANPILANWNTYSGALGGGAYTITLTGTSFIGGGGCAHPGCERVDLNGDCQVSLTDLTAFLALFGSTDPRADFDNNGSVGLGDLTIFLSRFGTNCN